MKKNRMRFIFMAVLVTFLLLTVLQLTSAKSVNHPLVRMRNQEAQLIAEH